MFKIPVKFQKARPKTVGGVALTRYLLQTRTHAPRITHHAPRNAKNYVPSLFFEKAGHDYAQVLSTLGMNSSLKHVRNIHYENMPIQIYCKFYHPKNEKFQIKNSDIFLVPAQNIEAVLTSTHNLCFEQK